jgi:transposase
MYSRSGLRRRHGADLKAAVLAACDEPGSSVAAIAQAHGANASGNLAAVVSQLARDHGTPRLAF